MNGPFAQHQACGLAVCAGGAVGGIEHVGSALRNLLGIFYTRFFLYRKTARATAFSRGLSVPVM